MKKIITGLLILCTSFAFSQDLSKNLLEGIWGAEETSFACIITVNESLNRVETIHNVSFSENYILIETILNQNDHEVYTTHTNYRTGHTVKSTYKLIDNNHMLRKFTGDITIDVVYTKI